MSRKVGSGRGIDGTNVTRLVAARDALGLNNTTLARLIARSRESCSRMCGGKMPVPPLMLAYLESMVPMYEALSWAKAVKGKRHGRTE